MKSITKEIGDITITVDYRTELLGIIMWIGSYHKNYPHLFKEYSNKNYTDRIIKEFKKFKDEEVVKSFDNLVKKHGFSYDAVYNLFLQLDDNYKCKNLSDYIFIDRLNKDKEIYLFLDKLKEFSNKIGFEKYYQNNSLEYEKFIDNMSKSFNKYDIKKFLKEYYGYDSGKKLIINLLPHTTSGSYCCNYDDKVYSCFPVFRYMQEDKLFDCEGQEKNILNNLIHEFSHSYVNPITTKYNLLNKDTNYFDDISKEMSKEAYSSDATIINEHIIRGITARYILLMYKSNDLYEKCLEKERMLGFKYIDNIISSLLEYESKKEEYPTFDMFYPKLISNLLEYKEKL